MRLHLLGAAALLLFGCANLDDAGLGSGLTGYPDVGAVDQGAGGLPLPIPSTSLDASTANDLALRPAAPPPDARPEAPDDPDVNEQGPMPDADPDPGTGDAFLPPKDGGGLVPVNVPDAAADAPDGPGGGDPADAYAAPDADALVPAECAQGETRDCEACPGVRQVCIDGRFSECRGPEEVCDGVDNDCDGLTDEGPDGAPLAVICYDGPPLSGGEGECRAGVRVCEVGAYGGICVGQVTPMEEVCDGRDNDCDGDRDEAPDGVALSAGCYDGPPATEGVGQCRGGTRICQGGLPSACGDQVLPGLEICDGADNDCNGVVDDAASSCDCVPGTSQHCYGGAPETEGVGACRAGTQFCDGTGRLGECMGDQSPESETCDAQDNDCDDLIDEDVDGEGAPCERGVGACAVAGVVVCDAVAGALICGAVEAAPSVELCNALDDDCDGAADEGFPVGQACSVGVGECAVANVFACDALGGVECASRPDAPGLELCNGLDDDCDGVADNGLDLGAPCSAGVGSCLALGQRACAGDGTVLCSAVPLSPTEERCNGGDDDCDGAVDESDVQLDAPCGTGLPGICGTGVVRCPDGVLRCAAVTQPAEEICDGLDNDCDGRADNSLVGGPLARVCYEGAPGTEGIGRCQGGAQVCQLGAFGLCNGQVVPAVEVCDGADDDCDGVVDNVAGAACQCRPGDAQPCYGGPAGTAGVGVCGAGMQTCLPDGTGFGGCVGEVTPGVEVCNGVDDDCDGAADNPAGAGAACESGLGLCARPGVFACDPLGGNLMCNAVAGAPAEELCDGQDNDCNGRVDDVVGLGAFCRVPDPAGGQCQPEGTRVCQPGAGLQPVCVALANPAQERCNGVDDNNNLCVDEGIAEPVGQACSVGVGECARSGVTSCQGVAGVACNVAPGAPGVEVCDGRDNNCDGRADDNPSDVGRACTAGVGACARQGLSNCNGGSLGCSAVPGNASGEVCNAVDDNCNGAVDEGGVCDVFASCLAARNAGRAQSGVQPLQPQGAAQAVNVYCDQVTDDGGWTLVGSTRATTLNDQAQAWYADLQTLAPAGSNLGIWNGLRTLGFLWDMRFACRNALGAADAAMTVDLSFYNMPWYSEFTTGTDADSCFSEADGNGDDQPAPGRRNNLTGAALGAGAPYQATGLGYVGNTFLEGEDACGSTDDFTVDYTDRGMDSDQSDGTDWGEDDGTLKCGVSGVATGQWFVFVRERGGVPPPACGVEDVYEENDAQGAAAPLNFAGGRVQVQGGLCGAESDWFAFDGRVNCTYDVTLTFTHANGDVDTTLHDAAGLELDGSFGVGNSEAMNYRVAVGGAQRLAIRVYGYNFTGNSSNTYTLVVTETCN